MIAAYGFSVALYGPKIVLEKDGDPLEKLHEARGPQDALSVLIGIAIGLRLAKEKK